MINLNRLILVCFLFCFGQIQGQESYSKAYLKVDSVMTLGVNYYNSDLDSFNYLNEKAFQMLGEGYSNAVTVAERNRLTASYYNNKAVYLQSKGIVKEALVYMDSTILYSNELDDDTVKATYYNNLGTMYQDAGDVYNSIRNHEKAIEFRVKIKDTLRIANSYNNIGFVYFKQKLFDKALDYFRKSVALYQSQNNFGEVVPRINLADVYRDKQDLDNYYKQISRVYLLAQEFDNEMYRNRCYAKMGFYYLKKEQLDTAAYLLEKSEKYFAASDNNKRLASIYSDLARLFAKKKDMNKALSYALKAKTTTENMDLRSSKSLVFQMLYEIYSELGKNKEALNYLGSYHSLKDSLEDEEFFREQLFKENELKFKAEKDSLELAHYAQMKVVEEQIKAEEQFRVFMLLSILGVLLLALITARNYRLKQKLVKENYEKEQLLNQHLSDELKAKTKKLVNSSLKNVKNQKAIQEIENLIGEISRMESEEFEKNIRQIKSEIRDSKFTTKKLDNYQDRITAENESFTTALKSKYPSLTPKELKLCVLLRMNYSTDEICDVLGVASTTLKSSRYRIHKKMGLEKGMRLQDHLLQLT